MSKTPEASNPQDPDNKKARHRSPAYPTIGLEESVTRLQQFYKHAGKAGAPPEIAVVHMGFKTAHGQAMSALAALKKFGLVEEVNNRIAPSQRGLEIVNLSETDPRRVQALKDALVSPPIYRTLIEEYRAVGFPSNDALERELVTYKQFNPNAVGAFVRDLKSALEFAGITDLSSLDLPPEQNQEVQMSTTEASASKPKAKSQSPAGRSPFAPFFQQPAPAPPPPKGTSLALPVEFSVGENGEPKVILAHITFDGQLKKEHLTRLRGFLEAMEAEFDGSKK
jgi:hypothetical protein